MKERERERERKERESGMARRGAARRDSEERRALEIWGGDRSGLCALHATLNASQPRPCLRSFARSPSPARPRDCCLKQHTESGDGDPRRDCKRASELSRIIGRLALPRRLRKKIAARRGAAERRPKDTTVGSAFSAIRKLDAARPSKRRPHEVYITRQMNIRISSLYVGASARAIRFEERA